MQSAFSKSEMLNNHRSMLLEVLHLRTQGGAYARLARAQGYLDGYMRLLMDANIADQKELLRLVSEERCAAEGPLKKSYSLDSGGEVTA
jgi:hypothetical protein